MTVYWADPFLEASTQGTGTTDTTTRDGTYAAPFSVHADLIYTSSTAQTSLNGVTLADDDEIRIKGLAFATLFETQGNVYEDRSYFTTSGELKPITGNSTFDATINATTSGIFAFQNSDISSYLPGWSHPLFLTANRLSNSTKLRHQIFAFTQAVLRDQLSYTSASSTGMEIFKLKDTYANMYSMNSYRYAFNLGKNVKVSAGWTSTTAQSGYSILEAGVTTTFEHLYIGGSSTNKTYFDLGRLVVALRPATNTTDYATLRLDPAPCTDGGTGTVTMPIAALASYYGPYLYSASTGTDVVFPALFGLGLVGGSRANIYHLNNDVMQFNNLLASHYDSNSAIEVFQSNSASSQFKIGNMYSDTVDTGSFNGPFEFYSTNYYDGGVFTFLQNSVYFLIAANTSLDVFLTGPATTTTSVVYESGLKKPGQAPLTNVSATDNEWGPHYGRLIDKGADLFSTDITLSNSQDWFDPVVSRSGSNPIVYNSLGKLICGGSNYKTTAQNIGVRQGTAVSSTGAPQFVVSSFEHNDYDGKPISVIGDPYTAGLTYGSLVYNDTVSSTDVLTVQWGGVTGGASTHAWLPLDLVVPSYTAGTDNLRAKVTVAYDDANTGAVGQGQVYLRAFHRDTTQSTNFRIANSSATAITATDPASPATVTVNLSNVATSGQDDITTVLLGIRFNFTSNTNVQKYHLVSAEIETY